MIEHAGMNIFFENFRGVEYKPGFDITEKTHSDPEDNP